jgi:hypothetical protein
VKPDCGSSAAARTAETGKWREFDRFELEMRAWIPYSSWHIGYDEPRGSYAEVRKDYGFSDFDEFENSKPYALVD